MTSQNKSPLRILTESNQNSPQKSHNNKYHSQKKSIPQPQPQIQPTESQQLINIILSDPLLKSLNNTLQKQAQFQKKSKLLESFPIRYQNLVHTQYLYSKQSQQFNQYKQQSSQLINTLQKQLEDKNDMIQYFKVELEKKNGQKIQNQEKQKEKSKKIMDDHLLEIGRLEEARVEAQRRSVRIKCDRENLVQFIEEIKEEGQVLKKQNLRMIKLLKEYQENISVQKQSLLAQIQKLNLQQNLKEQSFRNIVSQNTTNIKKLTQENNQMKDKINQLQLDLLESQKEINQSKQQFEQKDNQRYEQIQEVRSKLLSQIKLKNQTQQHLDTLHEQYQELQQRSDDLYANIQKMNECFAQKSKEHLDEIKTYVEKLHNVEKNRKEAEHKFNLELANLKKEKALIEGENQALIRNIQKIESHIKILEQQKNQQLKENSNLKNQNQTKKSSKSEISKIGELLKMQITKFKEIVDQKDKKMDQMREQVSILRISIKNIKKQKESLNQEKEAFNEKLALLIKEGTLSNLTVEKLKENQSNLHKKLKQYDIRVNKANQTQQTQTDVKVDSEINLSKLQSRYSNILQEFQLRKKDFNGVLKQKDQIITELEFQIYDLKKRIEEKSFENIKIDEVVDEKIHQLKSIYETKLKDQEEHSKGVIGYLRKEIDQISASFAEKKEMEEQIYKELALQLS